MVRTLKNELEFNCQMQVPPESKTIAWMTEHKWMDGPDCEHHAPTLGLDLVKGVLSHAAAAGKSKDHVVAVVDVRRAYFNAEPLPKTFAELPDYFFKR